MIELLLSLAAGAGFLVLLYLLARRDSKPEGGAGAMVEARQALNSLQTGLLPTELVERIFAREDLDYVREACPRQIRKSFLRERKRIALCWIAHVRKQVLNLRRFHSGQSRRYAQLEFRTEIALALDFAALLIVCRVLQAIFYVRGPYAAPRIVGKVIRVAGDICGVSERSLAFLTLRNADLYRDDSARDRATI